ncbi:MAG: hypothetical protein K6L80_12490 [Agarilytica sp.]
MHFNSDRNLEKTPVFSAEEQTILNAIEIGAARYFQVCELRVGEFSKKHFCYPGAWDLNKHAFGWDLLKMPSNLIWAPFYMVIQLLGMLLRKLKCPILADLLSKTPNGFATQVQKQTRKHVYSKLLGSPSHPTECELHRCILESLTRAQSVPLTTEDEQLLRDKLRPIVNQTLAQYAVTRTASADITNTLLSTATGALTFKQFTPGGLGLGLVLASVYAQYSAKSNFIFGDTLGGLYYAAFPTEPSIQLMAISTLVILALLSILASFSGLLTDPIQYRLGLHQYRLKKLIRHMKADFNTQSRASFHPKDQYLARIMEVFDALKTHLS